MITRWPIWTCLLLGMTLFAPPSFAANPYPLPRPEVPDGVGVNIHFTDPQPGEMAELAAAGFHWIRMDFAWGSTEVAPGKYDFSAYDRLMAALAPYHIRPLFILDYSNKFYDNGQSPHSDKAVAAFARWAAAAVVHFKNHGILWEMYNEPNGGFWSPHADVQQYTKLALAVGKAIKAAAPNEYYIGPATAGMDFGFLQACFKAGLLRYWDAVSVHPYRGSSPETAAADFARLRQLIAEYEPKGKQIPIISSEWGYTSVQTGIQLQAEYLARMWLSNLSNGIILSIWYDWHDDGPDPNYTEDHFGTTHYPYREGQNPVYDPKPAYLAAKTLTTQLHNMAFKNRIALESAADYCLLFSHGKHQALAVWTTGKPHTVELPVGSGKFVDTNLTGDRVETLAASGKTLTVRLSGAPQYLKPVGHSVALEEMSNWSGLPTQIEVRAGTSKPITTWFMNPSNRPAKVSLSLSAPDQPQLVRCRPSTSILVKPGAKLPIKAYFELLTRSDKPVHLVASLVLNGSPLLAQPVMVAASNPLVLTPPILAGNRLVATVQNPSGDPFIGRLLILHSDGLKLERAFAAVKLSSGEKNATIYLPVSEAPPAGQDYRIAYRLISSSGFSVLPEHSYLYRPISAVTEGAVGDQPSDFTIVPDGDPKVEAHISMRIEPSPDEAVVGYPQSLRIDYQYATGWKFLRVSPQSLMPIEGKPIAYGLWIYGDGSGNWPRLRFTDATNQTFQPSAGPITWKGWRYVTMPLSNATEMACWGGAGDGHIHYPIHWDTLFLLDSANRQATHGRVYITGLTLIYPNSSAPTD